MQHRVELLAALFNGRGALLLIEGVIPAVKWFLPSGHLNPDEQPGPGIIRIVQDSVIGIWPEEAEVRLFNVEKNRPGVISLGYVGIVSERTHFKNANVRFHGDWRSKIMDADYALAHKAWNAAGFTAPDPIPSAPADLLEPPELTFRQLTMLKDLYNGIGAQRPKNNPTLAALREKGCVILQDAPGGRWLWRLTELGRQAISS